MAALPFFRGLLLPASVLLAGFLIVACDSSGGAGLGLIGEGGGIPQRQDIAASNVAVVDTFSDVTGGLARQTQLRILTGSVDDPLLGPISAIGYIDFARPDDAEAPIGFFSSNLTGATLRLRVDYRYGYEDQPLEVNLFEVAEPWDPVGATSDQEFEAGLFVTSFTVAPGDTLVDVTLPESYVASRDSLFRSIRFNSDFHGFRLESGGSPGKIVGFDALSSSLRMVNPEDTLAYASRELFTGITRQPVPMLPDGRIAIVDGIGNQIAFDFDLPEIGRVPLANVTLRVEVDSNFMPTAGFVRHLPTILNLVALDESEGNLDIIASASFNEERGQYSFASTSLTQLFQNLLFGETRYRQFFLRIPSTPNSVNALILEAPDENGVHPISLSLVVIPQRVN